MSDSSQEFLARSGPRQLTDEEARQFHMLRIQEGKVPSTGMIERLAAEAEHTQKTQPDDGAPERHQGQRALP